MAAVVSSFGSQILFLFLCLLLLLLLAMAHTIWLLLARVFKGKFH